MLRRAIENVSEGGLRIWFINHYSIPPTEFGGTRHYALAHELTQRGHQVTLIASSYDHFCGKDTRLAPGETWKRENVGGVDFLWLRTPPYQGNIARLGNMLAFAYRVWVEQGFDSLPRPDVVVGSSPQLFGAFAAERVARRYGVPFILEVRDIWPQSLVEVSGIPASHPLIVMMSFLEKYLYRSAQHILTLLPAAVAHMVELGADERHITWLPNGVDLSLCPQVAPLPGNVPFTVLYAGSHGLANGLDSILDAAAILQNEGLGDQVLFRFVGQGPEKARLVARAHKEGLSLVRFEDPVPKAAVFNLLAEADAFIVTMRNLDLYRHGISFNKLYDYMAAGRPVIFGTNAANDPIKDAGAGFSVPPEDARAMAEAIKHMMKLPPEERRSLGMAGRRHIEEHFSLPHLADKLESVLLRNTNRAPARERLEEKLAP